MPALRHGLEPEDQGGAMSADWQQQALSQERYDAAIRALTECISKGVSAESLWQLAYECGISMKEVHSIIDDIKEPV